MHPPNMAIFDDQVHRLYENQGNVPINTRIRVRKNTHITREVGPSRCALPSAKTVATQRTLARGAIETDTDGYYSSCIILRICFLRAGVGYG